MDTSVLEPYLNILPLAIVAFFCSLLLTPIVGFISQKYKFIDLPASMRKRTDSTIDQRIHKEAKLRLGGIAVMVPFLVITLLHANLNAQILGIILGLGLIIIVGIFDDKYELSGGMQFLFQAIAASLVVFGGTTVQEVDLAGLSFNFNLFERAIPVANYIYYFRFPADLLTVIWILTIMNALNWVGGIDALGEGMTLIAAVTIMMLSVKIGVPELAFLPAILAGGMLGFIPYNFPPSKIMGGAVGHTGSGFLLAVLAIISGAKIPSAIILLSIPLLDMVWVLIHRMKQHRTINIFKLLSVSGRVHLHHRLMGLGFSAKQTLYIESTATLIVSILAFYFGGFSTQAIVIVAVFAGILLLFTFISIRSRVKPASKKKQLHPQEGEPPIIDTGPTPEERYAY